MSWRSIGNGCLSIPITASRPSISWSSLSELRSNFGSRQRAKAVPAGDFNAWLEQVRGTGFPLDDAGYAELAKPSKAVPPTTPPGG